MTPLEEINATIAKHIAWGGGASMNDAVKDLGAQIMRKGQTSANSWVAWMSLTAIEGAFDGNDQAINIYCRNSFYRDECERRFASVLANHYHKRINFLVDNSLDPKK